jgi:hypothetical protein
MTTNYTKRPYIIPDGRKIFQMVIKYNNILHSKAHQNIPIFGLKINHLATLLLSSMAEERFHRGLIWRFLMSFARLKSRHTCLQVALRAAQKVVPKI